jgi:predicted nucleic acid-binding protein
MKPICIDANVFIASTKGNEQYSSDCRHVIEAVSDGEFYLIEPAICLTEVIRNISKFVGMEEGKRAENNLRGMVSIWEICDDHFCTNAGYTRQYILRFRLLWAMFPRNELMIYDSGHFFVAHI